MSQPYLKLALTLLTQVLQQFKLTTTDGGKEGGTIRYDYRCCAVKSNEQTPSAGSFFMVGKGTWDEVRAACMQQGGDLASILSTEDAAQASAVCPHMKCYIGLKRDGRGQPFFWTDGSPLEYTAWDTEQPQAKETVVVWTDGAGGQWHDWGEGGSRFPGVCKKSERTVEKKCNTITDCEECLKARDPDPDVASDCVPVEPTVDGNTCESKRYIEDTKDTLELEVATGCNLPTLEEEDAPFYSGSIPFPEWRAKKFCLDALFPMAFHGEDSSISVLATIAHPMTKASRVHDPSSAWVEDITKDGFTVCVQETNKKGLQGRKHHHDDSMVIDYIAFKTQPFPGARVGTLKLVNGFTGRACSEITFVPAFQDGSAPKIVGTANHRSKHDRHVVDTVWFEDVTSSAAKVCVAVPKNADPEDSSTEISYVAWDEAPETIDQGEVQFDAYSWNGASNSKASACAVVKFEKGWTYPPQIQIGLNHRGYDGADAHEPMTSWIEYVDKESFKVCSQQLADTWNGKGEHDAFRIDWFATGSKGCPPGTVVRPGTIVSYYFLDKSLTAMPDLSTLKPNHVLTVDQINDDKRADFEKSLPDFPTENVAASWSGIITITEPDVYTFYANSDDGAHVYIDGLRVVDNVGKRRADLVQGQVRLAAGVHTFRADWYVGAKQKEKIVIMWKGAQTGFKRVYFAGAHCASPKPVDPQVGLQPGFQAKWFFLDHEPSHMPDVTIRTPDVSGVSPALDYDGLDSFRAVVPSLPENNVAAVFTGVFFVDVEGDYIFGSRSDDGAHVYIDGSHVVDNGGLHDANGVKTGTIKLTRGYHFIKVAWFERSGGEVLKVFYSGADTGGKEEGIDGYHFASVLPGANGKLWYMGDEIERFPSAVTDGSLASSNVIQTDAIDFRNKGDFREYAPDFPGERFAGIWKGDIEIVREGKYQFFLRSRDGSHLFVDGIKLIDNGGSHGGRVEQGEIDLAAGIHSYEVTYWDNVIQPKLILKYRGPDTERKRKLIQPVKFSAGSQKLKLIPGFDAAVYYFSKVLTQMPSTEDTEPMHIRTTDSINFRSDFDFRLLAKDWPEESAALVFTGIFMIGKPGLYSFSCKSNSGSHLWIDGNLIIDDGGGHQELEKRGSVELMTGYHMLKADFWKSSKDPELIVKYEGPDTDAVFQLLRGVHFSRPPPPPAPPQIVEGAGWCAKWYFALNGVDEIQRMPRFGKIIPQKIEVVPKVDYQGLEAFKAVSENSADRIAVEFTGEHVFEKAGMYNLCLTATSTANFKLNGQSAVRLKTKNGELTTKCKRRYMSEKRYMVSVEFFENGGNPQISLYYTAPGSDESLPLPSDGYSKELCDLEPPTCECGKGWCSQWYLSPMGSQPLEDFPDVNSIEPQLAKRVSSLALDSKRDFQMFFKSVGHSLQSIPPFLAHFSGYLVIGKSGSYTICTDSSDGSKILLNDVAVVESPGVHKAEKKCDSVALESGAYLVNVTFFNSGKEDKPNLRVTYSGPDTGDEEQLMESAWHSIGTCGATPEITTLASRPPQSVPSSPPPPPGPAKYGPTFVATGCCNENPPTAVWKTMSDSEVFADMYQYCTLVRDKTATEEQVAMCGCDDDKSLTCELQSAFIVEEKVKPQGLLLNYYCNEYMKAPRFSPRSRDGRKMRKCRAQDCMQAKEKIGCHYMSPEGMCWTDSGQYFCARPENKGNAWCRTEVNGGRAYEKCEKQGEMAQWERDLEHSAPLEEAEQLPKMPTGVNYYCNSYYKWVEKSENKGKPFSRAIKGQLRRCQLQDCRQYTSKVVCSVVAFASCDVWRCCS